MAIKRQKQRTGTVRVYDSAEMSTNFPKSRKLVKQYKFTVYEDGRIVKTELKPKPPKKTAKKTAKKPAKKGARRRKGGKKK